MLFFDFSYELGFDDGIVIDYICCYFVVGDLGVVIFVRVYIFVIDECEFVFCCYVGVMMNVRLICEV